MILRFRLAVFSLLITLAACTAQPSALQPAPLLTDTVAVSEAVAAAPLLPTPTPQPTAIPLPTSTPEPTRPPWLGNAALPAPKPLAGPAPWLVYPCSAVQGNGAPVIANSDGTGCVPFSLPEDIPADRAWISIVSKHGSYAAFRVKIQAASPSKNDIYRLQPNGLDDQIWIIKLPENRIVRKITQIDTDGWQRIQQMWQNPTGADAIPLPLAVMLDPGAYQWSPDGRSLAYTAVDKNGVDLFLYDTLTDTTRRMSHGRQGAFFWSWSPDSKWVLYHEMARCQVEAFGCRLERGVHYYAVTLPGTEYQFLNNFAAGDIDWIANNGYILHDIPGEDGLSSHLVEINLHNGAVTSLYEGPFYSYTYVPETYVSRRERYLLNLPADPSMNRLAGIYDLTLPPAKERLRPFHTGDYASYTFQWERTLEQFIISKDLSPDPSDHNPDPSDLRPDPLGEKDVLLMSILLQDPVLLGKLSLSSLYLSPDGAWFTTRLSSGSWALFSKQGKQFLELGKGLPGLDQPVRWLRDSSGFFFFASGENCASPYGCIYRMEQAQEWKPVLSGTLQGKTDVVQVIEP